MKDNDCFTINPIKNIDAEISIPGDKSISHRSLLISAISEGECRIDNLLMSEDCLNTLRALRELGITIDQIGDASFLVYGKGLMGLQTPNQVLDMGNSGTGIRLLAGLLAAQQFTATLTGDESLATRPMKRIIEPLSMMGARISARDNNYLPLTIKGSNLQPLTYLMPMASAQVKSAILLAGLQITGETSVIEPAHSRDHTEKMLSYFGADLTVDELTVSIRGGQKLKPRDIKVPGDISSAAFFMVAAAAKPGAHLIIKDVGLNPTRTGILTVLEQMGADIMIHPSADNNPAWSEPRGDIEITGTQLHGVTIEGATIPLVIDELPILAVAGALADGKTVIKDAQELRVKESDRISVMVRNLSAVGVQVEEHDDGMTIQGNACLHGATVHSFGDHRIAMSMAVAGLFSQEGTVTVCDIKNIDTSFPNFGDIFSQCFTQ